MGLVVIGNYAWYLVIFIIFIGFRRAEVRDVLRPFFFFWRGGDGANASHKNGVQF